MLSLLVCCTLLIQEPDRTDAIYRCPSSETFSPRLDALFQAEGFNALCIDPKPRAGLEKEFGPNIHFVTPADIDTKANLAWREATLAYASGKISPKEWLGRTSGIQETVHFLSTPSTPNLRKAMKEATGPSVLAEILLLSLPGRPCLTSSDIWQTRQWDGPGPLENWILAMNDFAGPMLQLRHDDPFLVTGPISVSRADDKPGLLIFSQTDKKKTLTFYFNNSGSRVVLPSISLDQVTGISRGLDAEDGATFLMQDGFVVVVSGS